MDRLVEGGHESVMSHAAERVWRRRRWRRRRGLFTESVHISREVQSSSGPEGIGSEPASDVGTEAGREINSLIGCFMSRYVKMDQTRTENTRTFTSRRNSTWHPRWTASLRKPRSDTSRLRINKLKLQMTRNKINVLRSSFRDSNKTEIYLSSRLYGTLTVKKIKKWSPWICYLNSDKRKTLNSQFAPQNNNF